MLKSCRFGPPSKGRPIEATTRVPYCAAVEDSWETLRWEVDEIREVGDVAVPVGHIRGKGRDTGVAIRHAAGGWLAQFDDGLITHLRTYSNREEALKAAECRSRRLDEKRRSLTNRLNRRY